MFLKNLVVLFSFWCFVLCNLFVFVKANDQFKIVKTRDGDIRGKLMFTQLDEKPYFSYKGIPFAQPPLGNLRFKAPQNPEKWTGVKDVFEYGHDCTQKNMITKIEEGSENCLFLNVFIPVIPPHRKLSVMVYIHGGGFNTGSGSLYGPDFLLDNNVILVTLNYRLGAFGFLSLGTPEYSGNMGLKDQLAALKWVNDNIESFGGNKSSITLFGQSAGGFATHLHMVVPASHGLFQRAIVHSGSIKNRWGFKLNDNNFHVLDHLLEKTSIDVNNKADLVQFIQNIDTGVLLRETHGEWFIPGLGRKEIQLFWSPVIEVENAVEPMFTKNPEHYLKEKSKNNIDSLFGYNSAEMYILNGAELMNPELLKSFDHTFEMELPLKGLNYKYDSNEYKQIAKQVREFYFGKGVQVDKSTLVQYNDLLSDLYIVFGVDKSAKIESMRSSGKTFYYLFSTITTLNGFRKLSGATNLNMPGASHGDELFHIFKMNDPGFGDMYENLMESPDEIKVIRDITKVWTNFAKYGNPSPDINLQQLHPIRNKEVNYIHITNGGVEADINPFKDRIQFWNHLFKNNQFLFGTDAFKDEL